MAEDKFLEIAKNAKEASKKLAILPVEIKNKALMSIAETMDANFKKIMDANANDLYEASLLLDRGEISQSVFDRLKLDDYKFRDMIKGIVDVCELDDPTGKVLMQRSLDTGLVLTKVSCPIGVLGIVFEARPDVISQISALAIKSSNALILKGGSEAKYTNKVIMDIILSAIDKIDEIPKNALNQVFTREDVNKMLKADGYIDLIIPRGGSSLVKFVKNNTNIPVLGHADGICHIYVDSNADYEKARRIIIDSKLQYPSACNSVETLLINKYFPQKSLLLDDLKNAGIKMIFRPESWHTEYSDTVMSVKEVENIKEAIEHINTFSSGHTDAIITENREKADLFLKSVDSAGVYHNASTRFADGFRYGFGAEIGISTNKTHARGPVGLEGLTIYKYILQGNGDIVKDYVEGVKTFNHKDLI